MVNGAAKIVGGHRDRLAVVYLRQSSMAQVREHTESTMRQYGLVEEAVRLGWAREAVVVIDTDLGVSGRWGVARAGFAELVARVCTGEVGAIFGIEISRLARSNAEVARLMEFAAITETLLIDADGVYDPTDVNDRMLLGLKSTMGEVELHVMAQRLHAAKRAAAERGELRTPLPVGYVHDETGAVVVDPDAEVAAAIRDLFAAFTACGSAYGVVAAFAGRRFPLRAYGGVWAGQLRWGALTHARVLGRAQESLLRRGVRARPLHRRRRVDPDGRVHTGLVERPRGQWPVLIADHHEGYIDWTEYLANEARLAGNRTNTGARPPREGIALCQGIIACGSCGKPMRTNYHSDQRPAYECSGRADRLTTSTCRSVAASTIDDAVAARLLAALHPTRGRARAGRRRRGRRPAPPARPRRRTGRRTRPLRRRPRRTRLPRRRTGKPFGRTDSRDTVGDQARRHSADAEHALEPPKTPLPPLPSRAELERLTADLPALWHAPATSHKDRKRLLRTVIADITLLPEPDQHKARIGIRWHTGATDEITVARAAHPGTAKRSPSPAVAMVIRLGPTTPTAELAGQLNAAGLTTGTGAPFDVKAVQWIRHAYHVPAPNPYADGEISVADAAHRLGCSTSVVYDWIKTGKLAARRGTGNRLCIPWTEQTEAECRCRITESGHLNPAARRTPPRKHV